MASTSILCLALLSTLPLLSAGPVQSPPVRIRQVDAPAPATLDLLNTPWPDEPSGSDLGDTPGPVGKPDPSSTPWPDELALPDLGEPSSTPWPDEPAGPDAQDPDPVAPTREPLGTSPDGAPDTDAVGGPLGE